MDLGGLLEVEGIVSSSPCSFSPSLSSSDVESIRKRGVFGSHFPRQGKTGRDEGGDQRNAKAARSTHHSRYPNEEQKLNLSSTDSSSLMHSCDDTPSCSATSWQIKRPGLNPGNLMQAVTRGLMGPFTAPQRMDLEQQMLIYSYIRANVPVPTSLLSSLRRGFNPAVLSACSAGPFRPNGVWWGYFHPGLVGNADPEPNRCRRTDGKKWRCSRDAVPDQKYCERHINRGRHRSRKPVERHATHANIPAPAILNATSSSVVSRNHAQSSPDSTTAPHLWMVDHQETTQDSFFPSKVCTPLEERLHSGGSNNLIAPLELHYPQNQQPKIVNHVVKDLNQRHSEYSSIVWTDEGGMLCERGRASLPLPLTSPEFSSSTSSPAPEAFSPLRMSLGVGGGPNDSNPAVQMNWKPCYWESFSIGGPLGEALTSAGDTPMDEKQGFLNLMDDGSSLSTPRFASSPMNAMQTAAISSVSSGSANDLVVEKNAEDGFVCCLFGDAKTLISPSGFPL